MALSRLGNFIELVDIRNKNGFYKEKDVRGISTTKIFIKTKANLNNVNLLGYKIVQKNRFAYVADTSRRGEKIAIAYSENHSYIISSIYTTFKVKDESKLLPRYLMMFFNRPEFDRYARFNSWGSARETFSWDDFCNIELNIPSIEIQKKYVAIYEAMLDNLKAYNKGLNDLKLVCDGYIEKLKAAYNPQKIGDFLTAVSEKNISNLDFSIAGISKEQKLIPSISKTKGVDKSKYYIVRPGYFAFSPIHINDGSIALNDSSISYLISPIYKTFKICEPSKLDPIYLSIWFSRTEFIRYCWFNAFGSARDTFEWKDLCNIQIPIPPIEIQKSISLLYILLKQRKSFIEIVDKKTASICPILIRGSILESQGEK